MIFTKVSDVRKLKRLADIPVEFLLFLRHTKAPGNTRHMLMFTAPEPRFSCANPRFAVLLIVVEHKQTRDFPTYQFHIPDSMLPGVLRETIIMFGIVARAHKLRHNMNK